MIKLIYICYGLTTLLLMPVLHAKDDITFNKFVKAKNQNNQGIIDQYYDSLAKSKETNTLFKGASEHTYNNLKDLLKKLADKSLLTQKLDNNIREFNTKTTEDAINNVKNLPYTIQWNNVTIFIGQEISDFYQKPQDIPEPIGRANRISTHLTTLLGKGINSDQNSFYLSPPTETINLTNAKESNPLDLFVLLKTWQKILHDPNITEKFTEAIRKQLPQLTIQLIGLSSKYKLNPTST